MKSCFPYYGGKSPVASLVWQALRQPKHYIEPFFGSGAVLLARQGYNPAEHVETINDKDGFIANVWRALQFAPEAVAKVCDWPVNHADLCARRRRMLAEEPSLLERLIADDKFFDAEIAGYWIWGQCTWIGSGLTRPNARPHLSDAGVGVHAIGQIPHLSKRGQGIHAIRNIPDIADTGKSVQEPYNDNIYTWFRQLSERLRYVRVVCGDWTQVCGGNWQDKFGDVGIFFDPPYGVTDRDTTLYHCDSTTVAADVMEWCKKRGELKTHRIVLAGYEEYQELVDNHGWTMQGWKAQGGYSNQGGDNENCKREALYFSPWCLNKQGRLF